MNTNKFTEDEIRGRNLANEFLNQAKNIKDIDYTENQYDTVDVFYTMDTKTGETKRIVGEIKVRDKNAIHYLDHIIELKKYANMTFQAIENNCIEGHYFNFFGDSVLYIYKLSDMVEIPAVQGRYNRHTSVYSGQTDKMMKHIPVRYAGIFVKEDGEWRVSSREESIKYIN